MLNLAERPALRWINPLGYVGFLALAAISALRADWTAAAITLWIAPIFDPFAQRGAWADRSAWMKAVLYLHVIVALAASAIAWGLRR